ncbi:Hypothetical predicted protein [Olea europaea subsp. europaea]|uniref:Uncharacterized protein n=1 Tax=Olea europaea subsp. europaea TaxID=158383 RepID=A0A8S0UMR7_OLEEU|nr:Hypothetical predicted protein [Olea europaea subsp. europaea]
MAQLDRSILPTTHKEFYITEQITENKLLYRVSRRVRNITDWTPGTGKELVSAEEARPPRWFDGLTPGAAHRRSTGLIRADPGQSSRGYHGNRRQIDPRAGKGAPRYFHSGSFDFIS